ncbi:hypothetical protein VPH35_077055 [Triticum aestivum]|uniref:uncharacterized protein isoform X1 n=1 Tax=Triticum aestivum TaxID=4565 RepID=UPI001D031B35|nr:uncharacterized protein LOC123096270 isoform X1 [Triticum aestivum]
MRGWRCCGRVATGGHQSVDLREGGVRRGHQAAAVAGGERIQCSPAAPYGRRISPSSPCAAAARDMAKIGRTPWPWDGRGWAGGVRTSAHEQARKLSEEKAVRGMSLSAVVCRPARRRPARSSAAAGYRGLRRRGRMRRRRVPRMLVVLGIDRQRRRASFSHSAGSAPSSGTEYLSEEQCYRVDIPGKQIPLEDSNKTLLFSSCSFIAL